VAGGRVSSRGEGARGTYASLAWRGGASRERFFVGERDWMGGSALLMGAVSLREELLNAWAKEGRDWGTDMATTEKNGTENR
jgi:hypothetical protein